MYWKKAIFLNSNFAFKNKIGILYFTPICAKLLYWAIFVPLREYLKGDKFFGIFLQNLLTNIKISNIIETIVRK